MKKIEILIADDHAIIRDGLKQIFSDTDDIVVAGEAANGHETMAKVRERDWDVLVLDMTMPGRNGLDLIRQIKSEKPDTPVLVLSMHGEEQYALRALRVGAAGDLTKECDSELLTAVIRKVAGGGVYVSAELAEQMARERMPQSEQPPHTLLSEREYQVFLMIVAGQGLTQIADLLSLSVKTVSTHKTRILQKMGMTNQTELVRYAIAHKLAE
ncbi:MAG: response regulator transcription factor [Rhodocyclales bacterium]|nr:response regulator transcription factor [Rhodocyclales bacterium]